MSILYTVDTISVSADDFKERISETGYFNLPKEERSWIHIGADKQIIMAKSLNGSDGKLHTFRIAIDT
jgi:hypothetical protein